MRSYWDIGAPVPLIADIDLTFKPDWTFYRELAPFYPVAVLLRLPPLVPPLEM